MDYDMDIAFLGGLFPEETKDEIIKNSIGSIQNAANELQWNFVRGLDSNLVTPVKIINSLYIGSYPRRYKKLFIQSYRFRHTDNADDINVGFCNLSGFKYYFRKYSLKPHLKLWALDGKPNKVLIAYALTDAFVQSIKYVKQINPDIKTCIIVPDLPLYMNTTNKKSYIYSYLKNHDIRKISKSLLYIDGFVLLTKYMSEALGVNNYVIVEGIAMESNIPTSISKNTDNNVKVILYTGTLNEKYGILNLINAFHAIDDPNYKLVICGYGDSLNKINEAIINDKRIIYKGLISNDEVRKLQAEATVVINPRQNIEEFTKYSFPSKNLEYLSSGTPLIAYKLDGIPDEYDNYIYYVDDNTVEALKNKIVEVCMKSTQELYLFGQEARRFVLNEKNHVKQTQKVLDMVLKCKENEGNIC